MHQFSCLTRSSTCLGSYHYLLNDLLSLFRVLFQIRAQDLAYGNIYGTPRPFLDQCTARGENVVLDLDVFGKRRFDQVYPGNLGILVLPPSFEELERRLRGRGTDADEVIEVRLRNARAELAAAEMGNFRYRLVNDDFQKARSELLAILRSELG